MKKWLILSLLAVFLVVFAAGCNFPTPSDIGANPQAAQTYAAQTIEARLTENAANTVPQEETDDPQPSAETQASPPTDSPESTPQPSNTPQPTLTPTNETPCNMAKFVKDVTVPDGTEFSPDENFTKTWQLKNVGTCTWNNDYDLVFDTGEKMGATNVEDINMGSVAPGNSVDVSVDLTAPSTPGTYRGRWKLRSADGLVFGLGEDNKSFFVEIKVVDPVSFSILEAYAYPCSGGTVLAFKVKNTGTKVFESLGGTYKNLSTDVQKTLVAENQPFTEDKGQCPPMGISNIEPGDTYWAYFQLGSISGVEFKVDLKLCTQDGLAGDCTSRMKNITTP